MNHTLAYAMNDLFENLDAKKISHKEYLEQVEQLKEKHNGNSIKYAKRDFKSLIELLSASDCESLMTDLTQHLYTKGRNFTPMYPWVFVRLLAREQRVGMIITPDKAQNKVIYEGVVLATWKTVSERAAWRETINGKVSKESSLKPGVVESQVKPGDHVLFMHWAGVPVNGWSDNYRVVMECDWDQSRQGGIMGIIDYEDSTAKEGLASLLMSLEASPDTWDDVAALILEKYEVIDKAKKSCTLSGA